MLRLKKGSLCIMAIVLSAVLLLTGILAAGCTPKAAVEEYPTRPITLVIPWPAGGRTDLSVRAWADVLEKEIGVPIVVANKSGGAGVVGAEAVASSAPDGYTFGVFSISHIYGQYTKVPAMDFDKFDFVGKSYSFPLGINVHNDSPWQTINELIDYSKAHPGEVKVGHAGAGASDHVFTLALARQIGVEWQYIPYKGDAPATIALASKEVDLTGGPLSAVVGMLEAGTVRSLGIASEERYPLYPEAPTLKEQGVDFVTSLSEYLCAPKGTPRERIDIFNSARQRALSNPEVQQMLSKIYVVSDFGGPDSARNYVEETSKMAEPLLDELGLWIAPRK